MSWSEDEGALRGAVCQIARMAYDKGFITNVDGNFSVRLREREILITPAGQPSAFLEPAQIAHIDFDGKLVSGSARPSTEVSMHLCRVQGAPRDERDLPRPSQACGGIHARRALARYVCHSRGGGHDRQHSDGPLRHPWTQELPESIRGVIRCSDVVMLERHGALTMGLNLMDAFRKLEVIEHTAEILYYARTLGGVKELSPSRCRSSSTRARNLASTR